MSHLTTDFHVIRELAAKIGLVLVTKTLDGKQRPKTKQELRSDIESCANNPDIDWPVENVGDTVRIFDGVDCVEVKWLGFQKPTWEPQQAVCSTQNNPKTTTATAAATNEQVIAQLYKQGFVIIDNVYDRTTEKFLASKAQQIDEKMRQRKRLPRSGDKENPKKRDRKRRHSATLSTQQPLTYTQRGSLRFDVALSTNPDVDVQPRALKRLLAQYFGSNEFCVDPPHLLLSYKGAERQPTHTDADTLFGDSIDTPPFYVTLITNVGTEACTPNMGPTEFSTSNGFATPCLKPNQGVLFDGLLPHSGGEAHADRVPLVYQVARRLWYQDVNTTQIKEQHL